MIVLICVTIQVNILFVYKSTLDYILSVSKGRFGHCVDFACKPFDGVFRWETCDQLGNQSRIFHIFVVADKYSYTVTISLQHLPICHAIALGYLRISF
jgi:hypothetical protein